MPRILSDLTSNRYGKLTVEKEVERRNNYRHWLCRCDCGGTIIVYHGNLTRGGTKSCGCIPIGRVMNDLTGKKFNFLTVIKLHNERSSTGTVIWLCKCDCGKETLVHASSLVSENVKSCGCYRSSRMSEQNTKHGMVNTPEWMSWSAMLSRCYNENSIGYKNYGGRGIKVCDRWKHSFENFYIDMGIRPGLDYSLDRKDVNGNYEPNNCRWLDKLSQTRNTRFQLNPMNGIRKTASGKFRAAIGVNNSYKELGTFLTIEEAQEARRNAETKYWS